MIHPDDVAAWLAQVRQNPEAAASIVESLAARLVKLDQQNEALRDELLRLRRQPAPTTPDDQTIKELKQQLAQALKAAPQTKAARRQNQILLVFTLDGRGARLPLPALDEWRQKDDHALTAPHLRPRRLLVATDQAELCIISDKGRVVRLPAADVAQAEPPVNYMSLVPNLSLDLDESISAIFVVEKMTQPSMLTLVTRKGYARSFKKAEFESFLERNLPLYSSLVAGDYLSFAVFGDGRGELFIASRGGKGVRFPERAVGVQAKPAIRLDRGDVVVGAAIVNDQTNILALTSAGLAAGREMRSFAAYPTAGNKGKLLMRNQSVIAALPAAPDDVLWLLTDDGRLQGLPARQIATGPGASSGARVTSQDDTLVALTVSRTRQE